MTHHVFDFSALTPQGIAFARVPAHPNNYGYPGGAQHQCTPTCTVWHITASLPSPSLNPLAGLDSWFQNPSAIACAHLGISGKHVHEYVPPHVAPYHAGRIANPDVANRFIADWAARNQNPNFWCVGVEVVAQPGLARVRVGQHLVDEETWRSMCAVDRVLHEHGLPATLDAHLGHNQIDGVNRWRDPITVYLPPDIATGHAPEEDEMQILGQFAAQVPHQQSWLVFADAQGNIKKNSVDSPTQHDALIAAGFPVKKLPSVGDIPIA